MTSPDPKQDARGQFGKSQADRKNNGLASARSRLRRITSGHPPGTSPPTTRMAAGIDIHEV